MTLTQQNLFALRNIQYNDLDEVIQVEEEAWPKEIRATKQNFENRFKLFPEGFFIITFHNKMIAVSTSQRFNYDENTPPKTWEAVTDYGSILKTHVPKVNFH